VRPGTLNFKFRSEIALVVMISRIGVRHDVCRRTGSTIKKPTIDTGDNAGGIVLSEVHTIGGCGGVLFRPVAAIKPVEKLLLIRDVLGRANLA
jgi:hypothetical protein